LHSSEAFGQALRQVDAQAVLEAISPKESESEGEEEVVHLFNEKVLRVLCLNQAIDKYQAELEVLQAEKETAIQAL
jgi:hypothetical protein